MQQTLLVMLGGAIGAGARFAVGQAVADRLASTFPVATLAVNLCGCLAMGALAGWLARSDAGDAWRLFLGVGVLGGFTTFSAFSLDWWQLMERGATGAATTYLLLSVGGALAAFALGLGLMRMLP
jgi:fluoride exporter